MAMSIESYRKLLLVRKHHLDEELEIQAQTMDEISQQVARYNARMLEAKEDLAILEARLADDLREGDLKLTKDQLEGKVRRDRERVKAWGRYQDARSQHEEWSLLLECWRNKGYSIKTMADLYSSDYFAATASSATTRSSERRSVPSSLAHDRATLRRASVEGRSTQRRGLVSDE